MNVDQMRRQIAKRIWKRGRDDRFPERIDNKALASDIRVSEPRGGNDAIKHIGLLKTCIPQAKMRHLRRVYISRGVNDA